MRTSEKEGQSFREASRPRGLVVGGAFINCQPEASIVQTCALKNTGQFADIIDHTAVFVCSARFGSTSGQENPLGPILDLAALANHLSIRRPKRGAFQEQPPDQ